MVQRAFEQQEAEDVAERNAADVAHEDLRRMPVPCEEADGAPGEDRERPGGDGARQGDEQADCDRRRLDSYNFV